MRASVIILIAASAVGLAGCNTGGGGSGGSQASLDLCGLNCPPDTVDGGGNDTTGGGDDTTGGGDTIAGGNDTGLSSGDKTIAFENGEVVSPASGALSKLTVGKGQARYEIDTKSATNEDWPQTRTLAENKNGSNAPGFFPLPVNLGASSYKEYADTDLQLQVWNFNNSHAVQYRTITAGLGTKQAFSFGGTPTANMPTTGSATYNGSYGSTAQADNFVQPDTTSPIEAIDPNGVFSSNGSAQVTANFGSGKVTGTLTPEHWRWKDSSSAWNHYDNATGNWSKPDGTTVAGNNVIAPFYFDNNIRLKGTINGNTYKGGATIDGFLASQAGSQLEGGFFGQNGGGPRETTGAFTVKTSVYDPEGGEFPAADNGKATLQHSGVFNAQ